MAGQCVYLHPTWRYLIINNQRLKPFNIEVLHSQNLATSILIPSSKAFCLRSLWVLVVRFRGLTQTELCLNLDVPVYHCVSMFIDTRKYPYCNTRNISHEYTEVNLSTEAKNTFPYFPQIRWALNIWGDMICLFYQLVSSPWCHAMILH